ncbi:tol-pal system-associated acyl-CoA thioesterase [Marilutibacter alkalisoli]|uniref:Tol-pal system-associated acyl-CoA thioesterase n=1 Tax=Marilutibacter alkalisoli TaxID=2591633 RepID=A0A514BU10_9GAMM|nr:tol-pal system-associated acyl-CoA thioesterase [Lysobacter alkalisoli]QDH70898.1 tol-pal system-associated acyl-CoA thioesterase [Lysobacter alkalisoli]
MFSLPVRIYWEDTDAGGVVYHARYVAFLERARTEWMRAHGHGQATMRDEQNLLFVVRSMELDFLKPARMDDLLQVGVVLRDCRKASAVFAQEIRRDGELLLTAQVRVAALDAARFRPCAMPPAVYDHLKSLEQTTS